MAFADLLSHSVTITNPDAVSSTDIYGNPIYSTTDTVSDALVQPLGGSEDILDRDTRVTRFLVFLPSGTPVSGLSTLTWEGRTLRVREEPRPFPTPVDDPHHLEVYVEEILG